MKSTSSNKLGIALAGVLALLVSTPPTFAQVKAPISTVPFVIKKPGNYYLTKNLVVTKLAQITGGDGIYINANNVTLDLNGFELSTNQNHMGSGINANGGPVVVRNGTVRGFDTGVYLAGSGLVENVSAIGCKEFGVYVIGGFSTVRRCIVRDTGGGAIYPSPAIVQGIRVQGGDTIIEDCTVAGLTRALASFPVTGIYAGGSAANRIRGNSISSALNAAALTTGIETGSNGDASNNIVQDCAIGIDMGISLTVYRDNNTFNCPSKFNGGADGGGNK